MKSFLELCMTEFAKEDPKWLVLSNMVATVNCTPDWLLYIEMCYKCKVYNGLQRFNIKYVLTMYAISLIMYTLISY